MMALLCSCEKHLSKEIPDISLDSRIEFVPSLPTKATLISDASGVTSFRVWGNRNSTEIFSGTTVSKESDAWTYSPLKPWQWDDGVTYDFLGLVTGYASVTPSRTITPVSPSATSLQVNYDVTQDNYDLMMAGVHRTSGTSVVDMQMEHMLSAVQFVAHNNGNQEITGLTYKVTRLAKSGTCTYSYSSGAWNSAWGSRSKVNTDEFFNTTVSTLDAGDESDSEIFFAIPQELEEHEANTRINVSYTAGGNEYNFAKDLTEAVLDGGPVTEWEPGKKYIYNLIFTPLDNVIVTVVTTEWDTIDAMTPGIILP